MKLSTKGRYGLRALVDLVIHYEGESVPVSTIATRQNISVNYLEQVYGSLRRAGIVRTIKGAQGGYNLLKDPKEITVADVLQAIEGDLVVVEEEVNESAPLAVKNMQKCIQNRVWDQMNESIQKVTREITLDQLATEYLEKNPKEPIMYYI